jgi:Protein of unknown function (DUF2752)
VNAPTDRHSPYPPADRRTRGIHVGWARQDGQRPLAPLAIGGLLVAGILAVVGLPPVNLHGPLHYLGIMDPLCGMTRGTVAVLRGQLGLAVTYNPVSPLLVAVAILAMVRWLVGRLTGRWLVVRVYPGRVAWGFGVAALLGLWVNQQAHAVLLR